MFIETVDFQCFNIGQWNNILNNQYILSTLPTRRALVFCKWNRLVIDRFSYWMNYWLLDGMEGCNALDLFLKIYLCLKSLNLGQIF